MRTGIAWGAAAAVTVGLVAAAGAVGTASWRITTYKELDEGEAKGVLVSSQGELTTGFGATRQDVPGAALVWSMLSGPGGALYLGTGDDGKILVSERGAVPRLLAALPGAVMVTSLALGPDGSLYAGTMPEGKVFVVDPASGKARELAKLEGADHVWSLAWDPQKKRLWAGTGPKGKLFAIEESGKAQLVYETGDKHVMSLLADDGGVWVGTSEEALLLRVDAGGRARAVQDFDGDEVRAIARQGGALYVVVNDFEAAKGGTPAPAPPRPLRGTKATAPEPGRAPSAISTGPAATPPPPRPFDRKGKGALFRVDAEGRVEQVHALADGTFTSLYADPAGDVYAGSAPSGKVFLVKPDRTVFTAFDVAERQVLALAFDGPARAFATGDAGALYRVEAGAPKEPSYLSKVFDADFLSRYGNARWLGEGAVRLETRSGVTAKPDKTWSGWSPVAARGGESDEHAGKIASPPGEYFQWRALFPAGARATVREVTIYYAPQNQRARVTEVTAEGGGVGAGATKPRQPVVKLKWKSENPDKDELVYRAWFREEAGATWRPLGGTEHEPLTKTELEWSTEAIPDGEYVVRIEASDERANPRELALRHELVSAPFLVDNRKPDVAGLAVAFPWASGRALDSFSPISELAFAIDGGDYTLVAPRDGLFDDPVEAFSLHLPADLPPGPHALSVRATDAAGNVGAAQVTFRTSR